MLLASGGAPRRARRESSGFTLIEMMVAVLLIGVGLLGAAALSTTVMRSNVQSSALTAASTLAQERIELFRTVPFTSITNGSDGRTLDGIFYSRAWSVTDNSPAQGLKTIVVTVGWSSRGVTHRTSLSTIRGSR